MTTQTDVTLLDIHTIAGAYRRAELSPVDVVQACLDRINRCDRRLNAWITVLGEQALAEAHDAESALSRAEDRGPLHGIPVAVKDNFDTAGVRTTCASAILRDHMAARDAAAVQSLRQAGAIVLGKTNMLEFAYGIVHPEYGQCNNPWNLERTSGGSSSGSVAAVAAGMAYGSLGTDTGGSIRIPAAYCGVAGLKPTYERISRDGVFPLSWSLDHVGPIARTVADVRLLLDVLDKPGRRESQNGHPRRTTLAGTRVGIVVQHLGEDLRPGVRAAFERATELLSDSGAQLLEVEIPSLPYADQALLAVIAPEATSVHERWLRTRPDDYAPLTRAQLELGALAPALDYVRGQRYRRKLMSEFATVFGQVDVIISPTVAWVAPREDPAVAGEEGTIEARRTGPYNLAGLPAISVPCGAGEDGLPVGLQIAGPWLQDSDVLDIAAAFEARSGWRPVCPPGIAELMEKRD